MKLFKEFKYKKQLFYVLIYNLLIISIAINFFPRNINLIIMIISIVVIYLMVIKFPKLGLTIGILYNLIGMITVAMRKGFSRPYYNSIYAFEMATIISLIIIYKYVNSFELAKKHLQEISFKDSLTGVFNARYYKRKIKEEFSRCQRTNSSLALIIIDIDNFKEINDKYGHSKGDFVLRIFAKKMESSLREHEVFCRYGGDEFVIVVSGFENGDYKKVTARIIDKINHLNETAGFEIDEELTISIGISVYSPAHKDIDDLFKSADKALYQAKETTGNTLEIHSS